MNWMNQALLITAGMVIFWVTVVRWVRRRPAPSRPFLERSVHALYRWAHWWYCFAAACDAGVLRFREERSHLLAEPECFSPKLSNV